MRYFDTELGAWVNVETSVEYDQETDAWYAVVKVNHFNMFAVFSAKKPIPLEPITIKLTIGQQAALVDQAGYRLGMYLI